MKRIELIFLAFMVLFTFAIRAVYLWRDFVFVYDQGRDAIVAQNILQGHLTLIGPTTGLFGVFLGPLYYYFLAGLYFIGGGNPIVPAYFFVLLSALAVIPIYILAKKIGGKWAGALAILFYSFSFVQWQYSRWLSNPTNLPLVALILMLCVLKVLQTKQAKWYVVVGLLLGVCMQLEAANAIFLIPALLVILLIEHWPGKGAKFNWRLFAYSLGAFLLTLLPQMFFEIKHGFPSTHSLAASFGTAKGPNVLQNLPNRSKVLLDLYARGWFWRSSGRHAELILTALGTTLVAWLSRAKIFQNQAFRVVLIWFTVPLVFHLLYTGNYGNFWDYYAIGQYPSLYILVAGVLGFGIQQKKMVKALSLGLASLILLAVVVPNAREWLALPRPFADRISLSLQLDAVDWTESKAHGQPFGMWAYTPSAQDAVYKYLFSFRARYNGVLPVEHPEQTKLMFLLVEDDPNNPSRREKWIKDMSAIGTIVDQKKFGAVTVFEVERKL